jgi:hypothetical protein
MKFISARHSEPFLLIAVKGDYPNTFVVQKVPTGNHHDPHLCGVRAEWVMVPDDASQDLVEDAYVATLENY